MLKVFYFRFVASGEGGGTPPLPFDFSRLQQTFLLISFRKFKFEKAVVKIGLVNKIKKKIPIRYD